MPCLVTALRPGSAAISSPLQDEDLGFALLPAYRGYGYAAEAAAGNLAYARRELGLRRVVAIVCPDNWASVRLLTKLGLCNEGKIARNGKELDLYATA